MGRCDNFQDSPLGGLKVVRKLSKWMERCDAHGRSLQKLWEVGQLSGSVTYSHQGGVKGIRKVYQLMDRYDGHVGCVKGCGEL